MFPASRLAFPLLPGLALLVILIFVAGVTMLWLSYRGGSANKVAVRLQALAAHAHTGKAVPLQKSSAFSARPAFARLLQLAPGMVLTEQHIQQAGLRWTAQQFLLLSMACGLLGVTITVLILQRPIVIGMGMGILMMGLPLYYVSYQRTKRLTQLGQQLPEMLNYLARYLRTGGGVAQGMHMISEKLAAPINDEFRIVHDEISFGVPLPVALANLSARVPNGDLRYVVTALTINGETGGNIIEILTNLSRLIRQRQTLSGKVRILASEAILSAWILVLMPFVLAALLSAVAPKFMATLWEDPAGPPLIQAALVLMVAGIVLLRKIVRIRV